MVDVKVETAHHGDEKVMASHAGRLVLPNDFGAGRVFVTHRDKGHRHAVDTLPGTPRHHHMRGKEKMRNRILCYRE